MLIKIIFLIALLLPSTALSEQNVWSRSIMTCNSGDCLIDEITWESNQEYSNSQGYDIDTTKHYCKSPDHWPSILESMVRRDGKHNSLFLEQVILGNCYETSFPKKIVLFEITLFGKNWEVRRAQWLYDQPERMYQGFILKFAP